MSYAALMVLTVLQFLSSDEFAPDVRIALSGGLCGGSWRGAFGAAQRQVPAHVEDMRSLYQQQQSETEAVA
jgi:hypothetical protein